MRIRKILSAFIPIVMILALLPNMSFFQSEAAEVISDSQAYIDFEGMTANVPGWDLVNDPALAHDGNKAVVSAFGQTSAYNYFLSVNNNMLDVNSALGNATNVSVSLWVKYDWNPAITSNVLVHYGYFPAATMWFVRADGTANVAIGSGIIIKSIETELDSSGNETGWKKFTVSFPVTSPSSWTQYTIRSQPDYPGVYVDSISLNGAYTITNNKPKYSVGGSIFGESQAFGGRDYKYWIAPLPYFKVTDVIVDGTSVGAVNEYIFENISANHTIDAVFEEDTNYVVPAIQTIDFDGGYDYQLNAPDRNMIVTGQGYDDIETNMVYIKGGDYTGVTINTDYTAGRTNQRDPQFAVSLKPNTEYEFSYRAILGAYSGVSENLFFELYSPVDGNILTTNTLDYPPTNVTNTWVYFSSVFAVPEGTDRATIYYNARASHPDIWLDDFQIREIIPEHQISLTKNVDDFVVSIENWQTDYQYQIWTWQEIASDTFGTMNQWVLSMSYTLGSALTDAGDGTKTVNLGTVFDSPDPYYTVAVKIVDGDGNFAGQFKDTYTPEEIGEVIIEKIDVDGEFAGENAIVKDIDGGLVGIGVYTNITDGVTYAAVVTPSNPGDPILTPIGNTFNWDVSALAPGMYSVKLTAQNGASSDERTIKFNLYKVDETINYGRMDSIGVTGTPDSGAGAFRINIAPTAPQGEWVTYSISEPWRSAIFSSSSIARTTAVGGITDVNIDENSYGVYQVATYIKRSLSGSTDDGMIRTVENSRSGTKTLGVNVNGAPYAGTVSSQTAQQITITPNAAISEIGAEDILYSYWRRDARGWVLIRDYHTTAQLTWTPARVGLYSIQVRVKGSGAGSYEMRENLEFNITGADPLLTIDSITLSGTDTVNARTPVTITANAVNPSSEDVLYKYIISNGFIYYVETAYTADPTYVWTPGKAGNYSVSVLVKNEVSYGKYDEVESFTVIVQ